MKQSPKSDIPVERLSGSVERVTFHSEESGFCVLRAKVKGQRELITVIGSAASITPGEYIECIGIWQNDRTHGLQFKANQIKVVPPSTLEGIEKYLGSGMKCNHHLLHLFLCYDGLKREEPYRNAPVQDDSRFHLQELVSSRHSIIGR